MEPQGSAKYVEFLTHYDTKVMSRLPVLDWPYSEGLRRGAMLVSAEVGEADLDAAMDAMEAAGAIAPTYPAFMAARASTGIDDASYPGLYSLIADYFPPGMRSKVPISPSSGSV